MQPFDKQKSRQRRVATRQILMSEWDPIGVKDAPSAADENDGYMGDICQLLDQRASVKEIADYLQLVETERMGLTDRSGRPLANKDACQAAAFRLKEL